MTEPVKNENSQVPNSLLACISWIWTRVLFPGISPEGKGVNWKAILILLALPAAVLYPCMTFHLFEPDEGRYAEIPREMLARGELVVPYLQGKPYLDKPPLMYWLVMASYSLFGISAWAARLIPALSVHGCILLNYFFGRRWLGEAGAFWGALVLALAPGFLGMGRLLLLDGLLTFLVTLCLFTTFSAIGGERFRKVYWVTGAIACGLGILTKGPVILILVVPVLFLHRRLTSSRVRVSWRDWGFYVLIALLISLPWYIAICIRLPEFGYYFFWKHNVLRFFQPFDHLEPFWFYIPIVFFSLFPTSLLLVPLIRFFFASDPNVTRLRSPQLGFMVLAGSWCLLFFSFSGSKLPTYVLPAFPALAMVFGVYIASTKWQFSRWTIGFAAGIYAFAVFGNYWLVPWYANLRSPMKNRQQVVEYCGDRTIPVVCYPRPVDSVSFYLGRDDLQNFRSKYTPQLLEFLRKQEKTVVLFSHRHSRKLLQDALPPGLRLVKPAPLGLCSMAVVEKMKASGRVGPNK